MSTSINMRVNVSRRRTKLLANGCSLTVLALSLAACTSGSDRFFSGPAHTASVSTAQNADLSQPLPPQVTASTTTDQKTYTPGANVGAASSQIAARQPADLMATGSIRGAQNSPTVLVSQPLPPLVAAKNELTPLKVSPPMQQASLSSQPESQTIATPAPEIAAAVPKSTLQDKGFRHSVKSGESLYAIARRYEMMPADLIEINKLTSPDRINVGQELIIPGKEGSSQPVIVSAKESVKPNTLGSQPSNLNEVPKLAKTNKVVPETKTTDPINTASIPTAKPAKVAALAPDASDAPALSSAAKFRWPVQGRVIFPFDPKKNTGINIEVPEGTAVRAAENGSVIYVGNSVEGYGNLVLIRHANGFVSAYAHLKSINVKKGQDVARGENVGSVGMTGSASRPQLHFELRKGATPLDPAAHLPT